MALSIGNIGISRSSFGKIAILSALWSAISGIAAAQTLTSAPSAQNFGQVAVNGTAGATLTLGYTFTGYSPLFSLAYGAHFTVSSVKCSTSGTISCTVSVSFLPHLPGLREDALLAKDASGNVVGTTLLYGIGLGPQAVILPGTISTIAGTGVWGYSGDGRLATAAALRNPQGIAVDNLGNLYIADSVNQVVRQISATTGFIGTYAGNGAAGYSGDGSLAKNAKLNTPTSVALDGAGNLYIADQGNNVIRKVNTATQQITTVAGGGAAASGPDGLGDGGPATNALLNGPTDIAVDGAGNLYIADSYDGVIRMVNAVTGVITIVAGNGNGAGSDGLGDGGPATSARLNNPTGIGLDAMGNLYIADSSDSVVRRVDATTAVITVVAGNGRLGYTGDLGAATNASLGSPSAVRIDAAGNLYIADQGKNVVRQVNAASGIITTVAGTGASKSSGDGGSSTSAGLANPSGLAFDSKGNLYVADFTNNAIRKVTLTGGQVTFPTTLVGQASVLQQLNVLNAGNQSATVSSLSLPANFVQQSFGFDCSASTALAAGVSCTIALEFMPTGTGVVSGNLSVTTTSASGSAVMQSVLSGTGATGAVPVVSLTSTSLNFGNQAVGTTSAVQSVTLTNTGAAPLQIRALGLAGVNAPDFGVKTTCQTVVAAAASCSVSVTFTPATTGSRAASLTIFDNAGSSSQTIALSGNGGGTPQAAFSSAALQFGSQPIGGTAALRTATLSNTGSGPLSITTVALSGVNSADFSLTNSCGSTVAAGATCSLSVRFSPRAQGLRTATLAITDNAAVSSQAFTLAGTGIFQTYPAVWRPSNGTWYLSATASHPGGQTIQWGIQGDTPVPGDYDGDGKVDVAIYRPSNGTWYIIPSSTSKPYTQQWGLTGDIPVPGDYDGDGKTDIAMWRPSTGTWWVIKSSTSTWYSKQWGLQGDVPVPGDYDGDGKTDMAVWRPADGSWWVAPSAGSAPYTRQWGLSGDVPVPGDYDGDGKTDIAVWRPSQGSWYILPSGTSVPYAKQWGLSGDIPVAADFDGDGKADTAVWRPANGTWYVSNSGSTSTSSIQFGLTTDTPVKACPK